MRWPQEWCSFFGDGVVVKFYEFVGIRGECRYKFFMSVNFEPTVREKDSK
jgi:hypothetical protein